VVSNDAAARLRGTSASMPDSATVAASDDALREDGKLLQCTPVFKESADQGQGRKTTTQAV